METNPEPKKPILFFFFFEPLLLPLKKKKSTSSCKPHNSLSLPAPKTQEQNQTQNPKQIPKSILVIWWRRGSSFAAHSGIDFLDLFTSDFFSSCFSLFLVQSGLAFFFPSCFSSFLVESGKLFVFASRQWRNFLLAKPNPPAKNSFFFLLCVLQMCNIFSPKHKSSVLDSSSTCTKNSH